MKEDTKLLATIIIFGIVLIIQFAYILRSSDEVKKANKIMISSTDFCAQRALKPTFCTIK